MDDKLKGIFRNVLSIFCLLMVYGITTLSGFETEQAPYRVIIEEESNPLVNNAILHGLQSFNLPLFNQKDCQFFSIYALDGNSQLIGGLCGDILGKSASVDYAWVDEKWRGQGIGTQIFSQLEIFAKSKDCQFIHLFTYEFQAKEFYYKLGYECVGTISNWIDDHDVIFFKKYLVIQDDDKLH